MKRIICGVAGLLMLGCSTPPTAPSPTALAGQASTTLKRAVALQTVTLVFYGQNQEDTRMEPVVGLPIDLVAYPSGEAFSVETDKQGSASFDTAGSDSSVWMASSAWAGYCATGHYMKIVREGTVGASMTHELQRCSR
jgi:hypothetical protein